MTTSVPNTSEPNRVRNVCITFNNYSTVDYDYITSEPVFSKTKYLIVAKEVGDSGTPHLQMYVEFSNPKRFPEIKKLFNSNTIHIEQCRGTALEASDYCKKDDKDYKEFGTLSSPGKRNDIAEAIASMRNDNKAPLEILEETPHLLPYYRMLKEVKRDMITLKHRELNVIILYGGAGTGKSRYAYENYPDLYSKPAGDWWDGYEGETTILLDDYYGGIQYSTLLNVLDRYKLRVPIKGGFVNANWTTVIITSNKHPNEWYKEKGMTPALRRRINEVYKLELSHDKKTTIWNTDDLEDNITYLKTLDTKTNQEIVMPVQQVATQSVTPDVTHVTNSVILPKPIITKELIAKAISNMYGTQQHIVAPTIDDEFLSGCITDEAQSLIREHLRTIKRIQPDKPSATQISEHLERHVKGYATASGLQGGSPKVPYGE